MHELILGGVRSGKSRFAEMCARDSGLAVTVLATATANDAEMAERIAAHRKSRPADWHVIEEPLALAATLEEHAAGQRCIIVDCLTLWLTNLLCAEDEERLCAEHAALLEVIPTLPGKIIFIGNETGLGVMPNARLARRFCDLAGELHQDLARDCARLVLMVAGQPLTVKGS